MDRTQELMISYYKRLQQKQGRGEALRQAQLEMLKNVRRRHPYYWASFIRSGEWANLEGKGENARLRSHCLLEVTAAAEFRIQLLKH